MFWENFYNLCISRHTKPLSVVREIGVASGNITAWKKGVTPNSATIQKIANYFDVSMDYLFGSKTPEPSESASDELPAPSPLPEPEGFKTAAYVNGLDDEDLELLLKIKALEGEDAVMMRNFLQYLLDKKEKKNSDAGEI